MVKKMVVLLSALGFILTLAGVAGAFFPPVYQHGDMIVIPMKVKTTYEVKTGPGPMSALFSGRGCEQYSSFPPGFWPPGKWKATTCSMNVQVIPPKCVAPAMAGPVAWGAPTPVMPGCKLIKAEETYAIRSPGCNPCVEGGLEYTIQKKQALK